MFEHRTRTLVALVMVATLVLAALALTACSSDPEPADSQTPSQDAGSAEDSSAADPAQAAEALIDEKCTACHSRLRVDNAQKDRAGWEATVDRMIVNGADLTDEERDTIIDYLSTRD